MRRSILKRGALDMRLVESMPTWSLIEYTWRQWRGQALTWWGRLSQADWDEINGSREKLLELLQLKYGWSREEAERQVQVRFDEYGSFFR